MSKHMSHKFLDINLSFFKSLTLPTQKTLEPQGPSITRKKKEEEEKKEEKGKKGEELIVPNVFQKNYRKS